MSGGYFDYKQYQLSYIEDELEHLIDAHNRGEDVQPEPVIRQAQEAVKLLKCAFVLVHRIDYFLSGDDGLDSFLRRTKQELEEIGNERI